MDIIHKYPLSSVYRSPDDPVAEEPVVEPQAALAVDPEPVADPDPKPAAKADPLPPWMAQRLGEETSRRQAAEEAARVATERAAQLEEITRRLQSEPKADPKPATTTQAPKTEPEFQTAVQQEAARQNFARELNEVVSTGNKEFGAQEWTNMNARLDAYGINTADFVQGVMDIDRANTHKIMFQLSQDGEKAYSLAKMSPTARIAALTRIADAMADTKTEPKADPKPDAKVEPKPVSRAPAPKPSIAPHAAAPEIDPTTPEGNEKMDDKQFEAWYKNKYMKRSA